MGTLICAGLFGELEVCLQDLEAVRKLHRFLDYAIISALIWFHQECGECNRTEVVKLKSASEAALECIHLDGALLAADFHLHVSKNLEEVKRCIRIASSNYMSRDPRKVEVTRQNLNRLNLWLSVFSSEAACSHPHIALESLEQRVLDFDILMAKAKYVKIET